MKARGLGRGLEALLGGETAARDEALVTMLSPGAIQPGRYQPRTRMDEASLAELAASIRAQGVIQPLVVRPLGGGAGRYELIAGERRWRAAQMAGLAEVPALVREVPDEAALAMSLIENIQREDLNPIEQAAGLERLANEFGLTHERLAEAIGRSRSAVTNLLRLLKLAQPVQKMLAEGALDMGHARALLALEPARQIEAANRIAARALSVREAERLVARLQRASAPQARARRRDGDLRRLEEEISERIGATVEIRPGRKGRGRIVVHYANLDHLDELLKRFR